MGGKEFLHPDWMPLISSHAAWLSFESRPANLLQLQPHLDPQVSQHALFANRIAQRLPQPVGGDQDELSVLRGPVGLDPDQQLLVSIDQPTLAVVLFLVMGVIRFLLPHPSR